MRIDYKILWVEDENSWYETTKDLFSELLEDLGFKLESIRCRNIDEVKTEVAKNNLKDYDLLLVDYTLGNTSSGDEIIEFIRSIQENPILTEVLFYSSAVENVRDSMHKLGLEGVYTADRKEIETKFELVFNTTIKKIQEVNSMRGLIMAETSDLDDLMVEIIVKLLNSDIAAEIDGYVNKRINETIGISQSLAANENTIEKAQDSRIFTSLNKAKTITRLFKLKNIGIAKFSYSYDAKIISTRNLFAHVIESYENGEKVLISHSTGKKEVFNEERCVEIRKDLIEYRNVLEGINTKL